MIGILSKIGCYDKCPKCHVHLKIVKLRADTTVMSADIKRYKLIFVLLSGNKCNSTLINVSFINS